jgi:DNA-binding MarR family transcriptional regulator
MPPKQRSLIDPVEEVAHQWVAHGWDGGERFKAALSVVRAEKLVREVLTEVLRPFELTPARHELLALLFFSRQGEMPMGKLSQRLMVHPKSVTTTVDGLERLGLVERIPHPSDRRATFARITAAGRERVIASTERVASSDFGLDGLSDDDARALFELLTKVRRDRGDFERHLGWDR